MLTTCRLFALAVMVKPTKSTIQAVCLSTALLLACAAASVGCRPRRGYTAAPLGRNALGPGPGALTGTGCAGPMVGSHKTYDVGPGRAHTELTTVPWVSLQAGDVVNVYYRPEPYRTKLGLRASGTAQRPVVINGVTDAQCRRPIITGENAVTMADARRTPFFSEKYSEFLGTIFIYRAPSDPYAYKPKHLEIRNLKITGAAKGNTYTSQQGTPGKFTGGAAGIYAIVVEDLLVENCEITGNSIGVFVNTRNDMEEDASRRITIRRNIISLNGTPGSWFDHNLYIQAQGALYEGNTIGKLTAGAIGSSLKDRSSGTVIRFNRIDAAARAIDLVETEGGGTSVFKDPDYNTAWVYGNLIVNDWSSPLTSSGGLIHWGGDNSPQLFRRGTLYFYYNTVVSWGERKRTWRITLFDLPSDEQRVEARGNILCSLGDPNWQLLGHYGKLDLVGTNWIQDGWQNGYEGAKVEVNVRGKVLTGAEPGFKALASGDFTLGDKSPAVDAGDTAAPAELASRWLDGEYRQGGAAARRTRHGSAYDLGAFER